MCKEISKEYTDDCLHGGRIPLNFLFLLPISLLCLHIAGLHPIEMEVFCYCNVLQTFVDVCVSLMPWYSRQVRVQLIVCAVGALQRVSVFSWEPGLHVASFLHGVSRKNFRERHLCVLNNWYFIWILDCEIAMLTHTQAAKKKDYEG